MYMCITRPLTSRSLSWCDTLWCLAFSFFSYPPFSPPSSFIHTHHPPVAPWRYVYHSLAHSLTHSPPFVPQVSWLPPLDWGGLNTQDPVYYISYSQTGMWCVVQNRTEQNRTKQNAVVHCFTTCVTPHHTTQQAVLPIQITTKTVAALLFATSPQRGRWM
jgi:hypothetical protein